MVHAERLVEPSAHRFASAAVRRERVTRAVRDFKNPIKLPYELNVDESHGSWACRQGSVFADERAFCRRRRLPCLEARITSLDVEVGDDVPAQLRRVCRHK